MYKDNTKVDIHPKLSLKAMDGEKVKFQDQGHDDGKKLISIVKTTKLLEKGAYGYSL